MGAREPSGRGSIKDWIVSVPMVAVLVVVVSAFQPVLWVVHHVAPRRSGRVIGVLTSVVVRILQLGGTRFLVELDEPLREDRSYLLVSNHQSMLDVPLLQAVLRPRSVSFVAKRSLARGIPSVSLALRTGPHALVDRGDLAKSVDEIRSLASSARRTPTVVAIFPEGTRAREGERRPFKWAGVLTMLRTAPELEIVPVAIDGSWEFYRHNLFPVPVGTTVRLRIGTPIAAGRDNVLEVLSEVERNIARTLREWRESRGD